ncbi:hypothetical protein RRG08_026481 [Elysia crispata]|uniref:Uncharacterized protein n=1 Tax=Elysia crispata TaxID=231223 RepID=A0AAE0Y3Q2_9GAST|nr:hypothetical protein RRG08_026481 [Elysia crispata]
MTEEQFDYILDLIRDDIYKQDTNWKKAITPRERLAICLRRSRCHQTGGGQIWAFTHGLHVKLCRHLREAALHFSFMYGAMYFELYFGMCTAGSFLIVPAID